MKDWDWGLENIDYEILFIKEERRKFLDDIIRYSNEVYRIIRVCYFLQYLDYYARWLRNRGKKGLASELYKLKFKSLRKIYKLGFNGLEISLVKREKMAEEYYKERHIRGCFDMYGFNISVDEYRFEFYIPIHFVKWIKPDDIVRCFDIDSDSSRFLAREITDTEAMATPINRIFVEVLGFLNNWKWSYKVINNLRLLLSNYREVEGDK